MMNVGRFLAASLAATVLFIVFNAVLFPLVFPDGLAERFANARNPQFMAYHALAFAGTGLLLTAVAAWSGRPAVGRGLALGVLLGLLVSLPEHLHLYAMTTASAARQFLPVVWTGATWALTTALTSWILAGRGRLHRRPVTDAPGSPGDGSDALGGLR